MPAKTRLRNFASSVVTVGITPTTLAAKDSSRGTLFALNRGDEVVWVAINGVAPVVDAAIPVYPGMGVKITPDMYTDGAVSAVVAVGTQEVVVMVDTPEIGIIGPITLGSGSATIGSAELVDEYGNSVSARSLGLFEDMLLELKKIRAYLSLMHGDELERGDNDI